MSAVSTPVVTNVVRDALVITRRNLLHFVRQRRLLVFSTLQPVMFVLLFAFVFGEAIGMALPTGLDYTNFLLPGIFIQSTAFRATQTAVGLAEDFERGVIDRFRSMPMARSAVLVGRTLADMIRTLFVVVVMAAVGYAIGFRFQAGWLEALGAIAIVALFGLAISWIFVLVALLVPGAEAAQTAGFVTVFPLVFASSAFVPVQAMPGWLQAFAEISPVTLAVDATRVLSLGPIPGLIDHGAIAGALLWTVGILAVFVPISVRFYRRLE